ncbi:MAG TPA: MBL fold metallo-hydrolase, partial [Candidatus Binataceae bacterium]|nr:MBL fold metallo-hydrolase [Candidatus Binataceae bacterium]
GCMFGIVPRELWKREHRPDRLNRILLGLTCPLITRGRDAILIDSGIGNRLDASERKHFSRDNGWLIDQLGALGIEPGDITHLIVSHLHFDHAGGISRGQKSGALVAAFPRARIFVQQREVDAVTVSRNERLRAAYRHVEEVIAPVRANVEVIDGDTEIIPGVRVIVTGGHTHGHQAVVVESGGESFIHMGDIVPTRSHLRPAWNQSYDLDAIRTMEQKVYYLDLAALGRWWVSFAHDETILAARVARDDRGRFKLVETIPVRPR